MAHEDLNRHQQVEASSNRSFGAVFVALFVVIACWPLLHANPPRWWSFGAAAVLALVTLLRPALLAGPNRLWSRFGILLGKVAGPVALAVLFYGVISPLGVVMRLTGKNPLRPTADPGLDSYWIPRMPPGPPPDSLGNQY